jgi:hypothetical protein
MKAGMLGLLEVGWGNYIPNQSGGQICRVHLNRAAKPAYNIESGLHMLGKVEK